MTDEVLARAAGTQTAQVRVPKAAELLAAQLRRSIVRGELREGEVLPPEDRLLERFGVSRPTLREAIRVLESEALVEVRRGRIGGTVVRPPDGRLAARYGGLVLEYRATPLADVFHAAATIESPCIATIARTRTPATLGALRKALSEEESAASPDEALAAQLRFHQLLIEMSGSGTMVMLSEMLRVIIDQASRRIVEREGRTKKQAAAAREGSKTHRRIVDLIEARDEVAAEELWRRHILETSRHLEKTLGMKTVLELLD